MQGEPRQATSALLSLAMGALGGFPALINVTMGPATLGKLERLLSYAGPVVTSISRAAIWS